MIKFNQTDFTNSNFNDFDVSLQPESVARVEEDFPHSLESMTFDNAGAKAKIVRYEPNCIEIETRNSQQGFLVLSEVYFDGWEARVDGKPAKIYRTDYTLRGIVVPAGSHQVEFVYRPRSFRLGAIGFAFGAAVLLLGGLFVYRQRS
jgi:uncharacterized membrane protein YfhO